MLVLHSNVIFVRQDVVMAGTTSTGTAGKRANSLVTFKWLYLPGIVVHVQLNVFHISSEHKRGAMNHLFILIGFSDLAENSLKWNTFFRLLKMSLKSLSLSIVA